ncbi:hypothetical protein GCM10025734_70420 [Kitasatospora paranensis]|uniref:AAA family ATPase n=1 Tax=Kitasatospora paranensis TaxID=258053 RepID=UPI0031EA1F89
MGPLPFVGRRRVLAGIAAAADRARTGWGGLLALTGPAGVGKTRTAQEAAARADGFRVLWAWCPSGADGSPFRPWARLLADLAADDPACARAVRASPPLRALLAGRAAGLLPASDPEGARLRLTGDTVQLVRTAAARRPLLLVLDDVHAADPSSLRLLLELAAAARTAPLLLLVTARDGDPDWPGRDDDRAELLRRADGLPLGPLGEPDVARLLAAATGADPGPADVRLAVERTGRDAFLLTELIGSEDGLHGPRPRASGPQWRPGPRTSHRRAGGHWPRPPSSAARSGSTSSPRPWRAAPASCPATSPGPGTRDCWPTTPSPAPGPSGTTCCARPSTTPSRPPTGPTCTAGRRPHSPPGPGPATAAPPGSPATSCWPARSTGPAPPNRPGSPGTGRPPCWPTRMPSAGTRPRPTPTRTPRPTAWPNSTSPWRPRGSARGARRRPHRLPPGGRVRPRRRPRRSAGPRRARSGDGPGRLRDRPARPRPARPAGRGPGPAR